MTALHVSMEGPIGELTWTDHVTLLPVAQVPGFHDGIDWAQFPDLPRDAGEWALWRCIDAAGNHWTRVGDAKVVRAAYPLPDVVAPGETVPTSRNWWVDDIPQSAFAGLLPGWFD